MYCGVLLSPHNHSVQYVAATLGTMQPHSATNSPADWGTALVGLDDYDLAGPQLELVQDPAGLAAMDAYMHELTYGASQLDYANLSDVLVLVYARISNDKEHSAAGCRRQLAYMGDWVAGNKGTVSGRFVDNDKSISDVAQEKRRRRGKGSQQRDRRTRNPDPPRPAFDAMLAAADAAAATGLKVMILATETHRFYRTPRQFVDLCEYAKDQAGAVDVVTLTTQYDLTTRQGRSDAMNAAQHNFNEAAITSERLVRRNQRLVKQGIVKPGRRAFGWLDTETHHPEEAALLGKAYRDLVAGTPLGTIANQWQADGVVTPYWDVAKRGPLQWGRLHTQLRDMLLNPRHAGHQVWRGEVVNVGRFDPIVDQATWDAAYAILNVKHPYRRRNGRGPGRGPTGPFTGLLRCGRCGDDYRLQHSVDGRGVPLWWHNKKGCYMTVTATPVEQGLWKAAVQRASTPTFLAALSVTDDDSDEGVALAALEQVRAKREEVEALFNTDEITQASYVAQLRLLGDRETAAQAQLTRSASVDPLAQWLASNTLSADATTLPDHVQRNVLSLVYHLVRVHPAKRRGVFDPTRIEPVFVEEVGSDG